MPAQGSDSHRALVIPLFQRYYLVTCDTGSARFPMASCAQFAYHVMICEGKRSFLDMQIQRVFLRSIRVQEE